MEYPIPDGLSWACGIPDGLYVSTGLSWAWLGVWGIRWGLAGLVRNMQDTDGYC